MDSIGERPRLANAKKPTSGRAISYRDGLSNAPRSLGPVRTRMGQSVCQRPMASPDVAPPRLCQSLDPALTRGYWQVPSLNIEDKKDFDKYKGKLAG